ncbi:MAG: hypothetical protein FK731_14215 [Asgard group archaeon]|nr:hypothetical protein [Asgard group archaeon]
MKKRIISIIFISLILIPVTSQLISAETEEISVSDNLGAINIATDYMTVKIIPSQGQLMWWFGNKSSADEMYKLQLLKIQEFTGDDDFLDDRSELGGIAYNLISNDWTYDIYEGDNQVTITLTLADLANGADIKLIMNIYTINEPIDGTDQFVDALTELKFDIIVNNWVFNQNAAGIAIESYLTEVQDRHRVQVRNGTVTENGTNTRTMQFTSDEYKEQAVAYYEWTTFANVYDEFDILVDTIDVGTCFFADMVEPPTGSQGFDDGQDHLWLTYPNYGDGLKMIHDPIIGINEDIFTNGLSLYLLPVIGGLTFISLVVIIIRKKKQ